MATLRAFQLNSGLIAGTTITSIYTVPTGKKVILKDITLQEVAGFSCVINIRLSAFGTWFSVPLGAYPAGSSKAELKLWVVLEAGQVLQLQRDNAHAYTYTASGSLMTI